MRLFFSIFCAIFLSLSFSADVTAQLKASDQNARLALASFLSETAECAMFYSILGQGQNVSGEQWQDGKKFQLLSEEMVLGALDLAKRINMKPETLMAMMEDFGKTMGEQIGHDAINIRILTVKHGDFCKALVENPSVRLTYWLSKENG